MKKIYLTILSLLLAFFVLAESSILNYTYIDLPNPKKSSSQKKKKASKKVAGTVSADKTFTVEGGGNVIPGSQLNYSILLTASSQASGVILRDTLNHNLSLVSGSLKATPVTTDDQYASIGNVGIEVNQPESGVLGNDVSPDGKTLSVAAVNNGITAQNGTYTLNTDGTFSYAPAAGFTGNDSFTYTPINADGLPANEAGTVTVTVTNLIYFVNASATTSGNGTIQSPFKNLSDIIGVNANPIFIHSGNYSGALTLNNNQKLIGEGASESIPQILAITVPTFSRPLPGTGGTRPAVSHTTNSLILASSNAIYGLNINTSGGETVTGTAVGNLKVRDVSLSNTSGQAIQITAGGVLDCVFTSISSKDGAKGISVNNTSGKFEITGNGNIAGSGGTIQNISKRGVEFNTSTNVTLKNINFISANTEAGVVPGEINNSEVNAALHFINSTNIILDNIQVNTALGNANARMGINLQNCTDFSLANSKILRSGLGSGSAGIYGVNTKGTVTITDSEIGKSARAARFTNNEGSLSLIISRSKFTDTRTLHDNNTLNAEGQAALLVEGFGSSNIQSTITESEFLRYATQGICASANETSSININIVKNLLSANNPNLPSGEDFGTGTSFSSSENGGTVLFNFLENKVSGRQGHQINVFTKDNSRAEGTIEKDTVIYNYVSSVSNNSGSGIRVLHTSSNTDNKIKINNNNISGISSVGNFGIDVLANNESASGRLDVINTNNKIIIGDSSLYSIRMSVTDGSQTMCTKIAGNNVNAGINGLAQFRSVNSSTLLNQHFFEGTAIGSTDLERVQNIWNNTGNLVTATGTTPNILSVGGGGTFTFGAVCLSPSNTYTNNMRIAAGASKDSVSIPKTENLAIENTLKKSEVNPTNEHSIAENYFLTSAQNDDPQIIVVNGTGSGFTIPAGKSTTITYSATVALEPTTCTIPNQATVSGSNFTEVNSNISTAQVIIEMPSGIIATAEPICTGDTTDLSTSCTSGTINWYVFGSTEILSTGVSLSVNPTETTKYEAACMVGGCESDRISHTTTVNELPSLTVDESPDICQGTNTFTIPFSSPVGSPSTYSISGPGIVTVTDESLPISEITVSLTNPAVGDSTYAYILTVKNGNGCISEDIIGNVSVYAIAGPENPMVEPAFICTSGTVTLKADNCVGTITWFDAADNSPIADNEPTVSENKSYYARCSTTDGCLSDPSTPVSVTVINPLTTNPGDVTITWTGNVSERWDEPCNWSPAWVPDSTNAGVLVPTLVSTFPPVVDYINVVSIKKLEIENGAGLFSLGSLNIKSSADTLLKLKGVIYNEGSLLLSSSVGSLGVAILDSAMLLNDSTMTISTKGEGISITNPLLFLTIVNGENGKINIESDSSGIVANDTLPSFISNEGLITYKGEKYGLKSNIALIDNTGTIQVHTGKGISLGQESSLFNDQCGKIHVVEGEFSNLGETINVGLIQLPDTYDFVSSGEFLNEGVLKANSVSGVENEHMIITNSCPIFTLGDYNAFSVKGIYSDSLLTVSAGVYSDSDNTFRPSASLYSGIQKLYADVSECSCCGYVVPFNFNNVIPDSVSVSLTSVCEGDAITLDAYCGAGTVTWYASETSSIALGTGRNFSFVPEVGVPRPYYVSCESLNCESARIATPESVTVKSKPAAPTLISPVLTEVCSPNTLEIKADGCIGSVLWSDSSTANPLVLSGIGNYSISALCILDGCLSDSSEVIENLKIRALPDSPEVSDHHVCSGGDITLSATCASANSVPKWYSEIGGINEINPNLTNVTVAAVYFVACVNTDTLACQSELVPAKVIVDTPLSFSHHFNFQNLVYGCQNGSAEIALDTTLIGGEPYTIQWQVLSGGTFSDLNEGGNYQNVNNDTLKVNNITLAMNNTSFRAMISNTCSVVNSDTFTLKVNQLPEIITHPVGQTVCVGNQTTLSVEANGSGLSYQWQVNTGSGFINLANNINYANVNTPNLTVSGIQHSFNNSKYRCVIFNGCNSIQSNEATIVVDPTVTILSQPINRAVCQSSSVSFTVNSVNTTNGTLSYKWQRSLDGGVTYVDVVNSSIYSGVATKTLTLTNIPANFNLAKFRCVINGYCQSAGAELKVTPIATVTSSPVNSEICEGNNTSFTVKAAGIGLTYRWQVDKGSGFQNILDGDIYDGATSSTLNLFYPTTEVNGYKYRCLVWGASSCDTKADTSGVATLTVGSSSVAHTVVWNSPINTNVGTTQAVSYIFGNNKILQPNGKASFQAGQAILLEPGFEVEAGAVFEAKIKNACQAANNMTVAPDTIKK